MEQQLEYYNEGRGGYVVYNDSISTIKFSFEFGGAIALPLFCSNSRSMGKTNGQAAFRQKANFDICGETIN